MAQGGPIESLVYDGRRFPVDGEADSERILSGKSNEAKPNGDGTSRVVQSSVIGALNTVPLVIDDARGDQEFLSERQKEGVPKDTTVTYASGFIYSGSMVITEPIAASSKESTADVSFAGTLTQQS